MWLSIEKKGSSAIDLDMADDHFLELGINKEPRSLDTKIGFMAGYRLSLVNVIDAVFEELHVKSGLERLQNVYRGDYKERLATLIASVKGTLVELETLTLVRSSNQASQAATIVPIRRNVPVVSVATIRPTSYKFSELTFGSFFGEGFRGFWGDFDGFLRAVSRGDLADNLVKEKIRNTIHLGVKSDAPGDHLAQLGKYLKEYLLAIEAAQDFDAVMNSLNINIQFESQGEGVSLLEVHEIREKLEGLLRLPDPDQLIHKFLLQVHQSNGPVAISKESRLFHDFHEYEMIDGNGILWNDMRLVMKFSLNDSGELKPIQVTVGEKIYDVERFYEIVEFLGVIKYNSPRVYSAIVSSVGVKAQRIFVPVEDAEGFNIYEFISQENFLLEDVEYLISEIEFNASFNEQSSQFMSSNFKVDSGMNTEFKNTHGGIDLDSANLAMTIKRDGNGVPLPLSQQDMAQLSQIDGFVPNILEIKSVDEMPIFKEFTKKF